MGAGTYYGVQYSKVFQTNPPELIHASYLGKTLTMMDTVESLTATGLDSGSVISFFRPPKGARWNGFGKIWSDDLTNSTTLAVGIAGAATKFLAATNHGGGAATMTYLGLAADIDAVQYEFDGATDVIVTTGTGAMATAKTITLMMQFVVA